MALGGPLGEPLGPLGGLLGGGESKMMHCKSQTLFCRRVSQVEECKLTWLVLGGDPAARSHRVEQFTAL